ncbi:hypothetical protein ACFLUJ_06950 [Chloroflexota bacterium]
MTLIEALRKLRTSKQREFIILCVAGMDAMDARKYLSIPSYYRWLRDPAFKEVLDNLPELSHNSAEDAITMLKMRNIAEAQALEEKILAVIKEELETKKYNLVKTHLGREVFTRARDGKLLKDVAKSVTKKQTWEDRLKELGVARPEKGKEER